MGVLCGGRLVTESVPMRSAMNEVLRDAYVEDCQRGVDRWNRILESAGISYRFALPSRRFHRQIGVHAGTTCDPSGRPIAADEFERRRDEWLPCEGDRSYLASLMAKPILDPTQMANWIAPPAHGIKGRPVNFEYVRRCEI